MTTSQPQQQHTNQKPGAPPPSGSAKPKKPEGLVNLAERMPQYEPGIDARDIKKNLGKTANVLYGYFLGEMAMPETIPDEETGEMKPWDVLVFELLAPCEGRYPDEENPDRVVTKIVPAGSRMIMTKSTTVVSMLERSKFYEKTDPNMVYEFYIEPKVGKTRQGRSLWTYNEFSYGRAAKREPRHNVGILPTPPPKPQLPAAAPVPQLPAAG